MVKSDYSRDGDVPFKARRAPFFTLPNEAIDWGLSIEAIAIMAYVCWHGEATAEEIAQHFGVNVWRVRQSLDEIETSGLLKDSQEDSYPEPQLASNPPTARNGARAGFVYVAKCDRWYKIGRTTNPKKRIVQIGILMPRPIDVIAMFAVDDASMTERWLHKKYDAKRTNGEWFTLTDQDVADIRELFEE